MVRPLRSILLLATLAACGSTASGSDGAPDPTPAVPAGDGGTSPSPGDGGAVGPDGAGSDGGDAVALSFVFLGCNRISKADWKAKSNPSSANVAQLEQTLTDVAALPRTPKLVFFTGDLVLGLVSDETVTAAQLAGWAQTYKAHPVASKVELVPMPGNHEMLFKDNNGNELSNPGSDAAWTTWLAASGFDGKAGNGPTAAAPNSDALQDDQSKLSYSFDEGGVHFVVLNTDTWTTTPNATTGSTQTGWIALHWLTADLAAAQASATISSIFVFGHKPIVNPNGSTLSDDAINPALTAGLVAALDGAPKVKAYLAAHAHLWDARKVPGSARGLTQVIAGNGGSALEQDWTANPPYYGFSEARVYGSGRVGVVSYQRPVPSPYDATTVAPAKPVAELTIVP